MDEIDEELMRRGMMDLQTPIPEDELQKLIFVGKTRLAEGYVVPKPSSEDKLATARMFLPEAVRPYLSLIEDQVESGDVYLLLIPGMLAIEMIFGNEVCNRVRYRIQESPFVCRRYRDLESALAWAQSSPLNLTA